MGSEMIPVDTLDIFQVEAGDYIQLRLNGEVHDGEVTDIEDNGSGFTVTLNDSEEGDSVEYMLGYDAVVNLMMYASVAV